jgi:hypothetical protein
MNVNLNTSDDHILIRNCLENQLQPGEGKRHPRRCINLEGAREPARGSIASGAAARALVAFADFCNPPALR